MQIIFGFCGLRSGKNGGKNLEKCCRCRKKGVILRAKVYLGYKNGQIIRTIINENALFRTNIYKNFSNILFTLPNKSQKDESCYRPIYSIPIGGFAGAGGGGARTSAGGDYT